MNLQPLYFHKNVTTLYAVVNFPTLYFRNMLQPRTYYNTKKKSPHTYQCTTSRTIQDRTYMELVFILLCISIVWCTSHKLLVVSSFTCRKYASWRRKMYQLYVGMEPMVPLWKWNYWSGHPHRLNTIPTYVCKKVSYLSLPHNHRISSFKGWV